MNNSRLQYRTFTAADIPLVAELYVASFNAPPWNDAWTVETAQQTVEPDAAAGQRLRIAGL